MNHNSPVKQKLANEYRYQMWPFIVSFSFVLLAIISLGFLFQYENRVDMGSWQVLQQEQKKLDKLSSLYELRTQLKVNLHNVFSIENIEQREQLFAKIHDIRAGIVANAQFLQDNASDQEELDVLLQHANVLEMGIGDQFYFQSLLVEFADDDLAEDVLYHQIIPLQDYADSLLSDYYASILETIHQQRESFTAEKEGNHWLINQVLIAVLILVLVTFSVVLFFVHKANILHGAFSKELESKVEHRTMELYKAQQGLNDSLASLKSIMSAVPDGIISTDIYGKIVSVNPAVKNLFGYSDKELIGKSILSLITVVKPEASDDQAIGFNFITFSKKLFSGENERFEAKHKSGSEFPIELAMGRLVGENIEGYTFIIRNVSNHVIMENTLQKQRDLSEFLRQAVNQFMVDRNLHKASDFLLEKALSISGSEYGFIGEVHYDENQQPFLRTNSITNIAWNKETNELYQQSTTKGMEFRNLKTLFGEVLLTGKTLISNHPMTDTRRGGLPKGHPPLNSFLGVPVFYADKMIGMYGLANRAGGYDQSVVELLTTFSQSYGALVYVKRILDTQDKLHLAVIEERNQAEKSNKAKSEFLSSMTHELRTPLNAVLGYSQLLALSDLTESDKEMIERINKAGNHLLELIDSILDLSKVESEHIELTNEHFKLQEFIADCKHLIQPLAEEKQISVSYQAIDAQIEIFADRTRLKQVVINLLSNAIKYNREQGKVRFEYEVKGGDLLRLDFIDTGLGIEEKDVANLFQPFNRLGHEAGPIQGSGVGLNYSQKIINLMGGVIEYQANSPQGSIFSILLPLDAESTQH